MTWSQPSYQQELLHVELRSCMLTRQTISQGPLSVCLEGARKSLNNCTRDESYNPLAAEQLICILSSPGRVTAGPDLRDEEIICSRDQRANLCICFLSKSSGRSAPR